MVSKPKALVLASVASMIDRFNMENIRILVSSGYSVDVVCNCKEGNPFSDKRVQEMILRLSDMGVSVIHAPIPRKIYAFKGILDSYIQIKKLCDDNSYNLMHCHSPIGSVIARCAANHARKHFGTKVIYTAHGFHFYKGASILNWLVFYPIEKLCSHFTDVLITINHEDYMFAQKKMRAKKIEYIPGVGVDIGKYKDALVDREKKRKELEIPEDALLLLSVGELNENKNHQVVIKALASINEPNVHYVIAGIGPLYNQLIVLANDLGVGERIHLLGYREDVPELYKTADILAFPSLREGLGLAAIEGLAAGLPVVCLDNRGTREYSNIGRVVVCSENTPEEIAAGITRACTSEVRRQEIDYTALEKYSTDNVNAIMTKIYGLM